MPQPRRPRRGPKSDRRRALELLASCRDGATEAIMLAHGFTIAQMVDPGASGTSRPQRPSASRWAAIIEAGRAALLAQAPRGA